jgi:hypothetical protein
LRTNQLDWDEERLWRTYTLLTDLESVFRSLKSELGLRPVYHHKEDRADGHLFITVLAYQCVQFLRLKLKAAGIHDSWTTLRETLSDSALSDDDFPPVRWPYATCAQGHQRRARADGDLSRPGRQPQNPEERKN